VFDGEALAEEPLDELGAFGASLTLEAVKEPGCLDVDVSGHRLNVYLEPVTGSLLYGLPPIIDDGARLLILGNMPSVMSLAAQEYYANPRNAFWRITGEICGFEADSRYDDRKVALRGHRIAVWDVLRSCRRVGSLDSAVEPDSMVANDFGSLFDDHPHITRVFFNGAAAEKNYRRLVSVSQPISYVRLPSTSPAQTMRFEDKLRIWRDAITASQ
jgi:hypoxanthine-DNA glycosylase